MFVQLIIWVALATLSYLLRPKQQKADPVGAEDFNIPTAQTGRAINVVFGTVLIKGANTLWYGHVSNRFNSKTGGYFYNVGYHVGLCLVAEELRAISVDEKTLYNPTREIPPGLTIKDNTTILLSDTDFFGGNKLGGGLDGVADILFGKPTQTKNIYLQDQLETTDIPAYRGIVSCVFRSFSGDTGFYIGTNPTIPNFAFEIGRINIDNEYNIQWQSSLSKINTLDMNPIHIIRECYTSRKWGMNYSTDKIDEASFLLAAQTLYNEGFGLSFNYDKTAKQIDDFILEILNYIDAVIYENEEGKIVVKLIRDDYVIENIPTFDESDIIEVTKYTRASTSEQINQISINYTKRYNNTTKDILYKQDTFTVQDIAAINQQGNVIESTVDYLGIHDATVANIVATRELKQATSRLFSMSIIANKSMSILKPGDAFKIKWSAFGIEEAIVRVTQISFGTLEDPKIRLEVVEDVFATANTIYIGTPSTGWQNPINDPQDITTLNITTAPLYSIYRAGLYSISDGKDLTTSIALISAKKPTTDSIDYTTNDKLNATPEPNYNETTNDGEFTPYAEIDAPAIGFTDTTIKFKNEFNIAELTPDRYIQINEEIMILKSTNLVNSTIIVERGALDTVPTSHTIDSKIWFTDYGFGLSNEYSDLNNTDFKLLSRTAKGQLEIDNATLRNVTNTVQLRRIYRSYPPRTIRINTNQYDNSGNFVAPSGSDIILTWNNTNRTIVDRIYSQEDGNQPHESGTSTYIEFWNLAETISFTYNVGLDIQTFTYTVAQQTTDWGSDTNQYIIYIYVKRNTYDSYYKHRYQINRV